MGVGGDGKGGGGEREGYWGQRECSIFLLSSWFCVTLFVVKHFELLKRSALEMSHCYVLYCY